MNIKKIKLDDIVRCYCASHIYVDNKLNLLLASEDPNSLCVSYSGDNFENKEIVWNDRGGCMSIIPIPNTNGEFLAINEFYLKVNPSLSKLVYGKHTENGWEIKDLISLPYLHRFDILQKDGINYLICAVIAKDKKDKEDWSLPGQIYTAVLDDLDNIKLELLVDGCFRNHGYYRSNDNSCGYFSSDQGVLKITPFGNDKWEVIKIMDGQVGEIAFIDIDNDGVEEMMTIEPFHGNTMKIYKKKDDEYVCDFVYPYEIDFAHTLVGRNIAGVPSFIGGVRRINSELFIIQHINGEYVINIVESGVGPANIDVLNRENDDLIISANHSKNEAAVYVITK